VSESFVWRHSSSQVFLLTFIATQILKTHFIKQSGVERRIRSLMASPGSGFWLAPTPSDKLGFCSALEHEKSQGSSCVRRVSQASQRLESLIGSDIQLA
jgi:hypothetical protein